MSCIYDDSICKYYEDGRCDFPSMGSGYPYDAPCFGFDYEDDEDWIFTSEKLPEDEADVLCCTRHGMLFVASYDTYSKEWISTEWHRFWWEDVYAWTALPERPRGVTKTTEWKLKERAK